MLVCNRNAETNVNVRNIFLGSDALFVSYNFVCLCVFFLLQMSCFSYSIPLFESWFFIFFILFVCFFLWFFCLKNKTPIMRIHLSASSLDNLSCCAKIILAYHTDVLRASSSIPSWLCDKPKKGLCGRLKLSPIIKILVGVKESRDMKCLQSVWILPLLWNIS